MDLPEELQRRVAFRKVPKEDKILPIDITYDPHPCPDCGKVIDSRVVQHRVYFSPYPHWRHQCMACKNYKDPRSNLFTVKVKDVAAFFSRYFKTSNK